MLEEVPVPLVKSGHVLIRTHRSLVSLGTERMLVEFGKAGWLEKARQQPEKVKQVIDKIKADGLRPTVEAVWRKLGEPLPLGYCNAGEVLQVGAGVEGIQVGDRVVSNGHHAEVVCVPQNLVAKIPDNVDYDQASFAVIGAIALQGIRLLNPTFGETVVVTGLGLIGLVASQLLIANGCQVIGLDFDQSKVDLAESWGVKAFNVGQGMDIVKAVERLTNGVGADAVLITASTKSHEVIAQSAQMSRKRGRIVLIGVIGLDIMRSDFYEKELTFQVSCSYGPGRYDESYELKGQDYPLPYVRWTEQRNFEAILGAISRGQLQVRKLISETVKLADYKQVYEDIGASKSIASIIQYEGTIEARATRIEVPGIQFSASKPVLGIIGAGNFTKAVVLPSLNKLKANIKFIASSKGLSGTLSAKKFGIPYSTTNYRDILDDESVDSVVITTQHHLHAQQVIESIEAGKHVFVEKPLALTHNELDQIATTYQKNNQSLSVGFNRRFSPFVTTAKQQLGPSGAIPIHVVATMNAGFIPKSHWTQDLAIGGGRIIGEACHLIDLITYFTDSLVESVGVNALGKNPELSSDNVSILLKYQNGANGVINYFANGHKSYSKERIEVYSQGRTLVIDNFRQLKLYGFKKKGTSRTQNKGHYEQFSLWLRNLKADGSPTIPFAQIMNTSRAAISVLTALQERRWVTLNEENQRAD